MPKVLFIDDDEFLRRLYMVELKDRGLETSGAIDGEDGLAKAASEHPDVIVLDVIMPKKNGFEVLQELKRHQSTNKIPVIMFSHLAQKEDQERAKQLGASEYLIKDDITYDQMYEIIKSHLPSQ